MLMKKMLIVGTIVLFLAVAHRRGLLIPRVGE